MMWKTYGGKPIEEPITEAVEKIVRQFREEGRALRICVGTDSQVKGDHIDMATVILFLVVGNGGFMYVRKQKLRQRMSMRERIMQEISASIETAWMLHPVLSEHGTELEVHADINHDPRHQSFQAYHDAMGYTKGMGFIFKAKPDAFASSVCADRLCH